MAEQRSVRIVALLERLGRWMAASAHAAGLKPVQRETLRYLDRANRFSRTPSALTAFLGSTKGTVSQTLIALQRHGLIRKRKSRTDGRALTVELTARGRRMLADDPLTLVQDAVGAMSARDQAQLADALTGVLGRVLEASAGASFGICRTCLHFRRQDTAGAPHRCNLLDEGLSDADAERICVEHEPRRRGPGL